MVGTTSDRLIIPTLPFPNPVARVLPSGEKSMLNTICPTAIGSNFNSAYILGVGVDVKAGVGVEDGVAVGSGVSVMAGLADSIGVGVDVGAGVNVGAGVWVNTGVGVGV